ncbi:MAG: Nonribosomal peptide synthetase [Bacteroidetes bacterium]|jgi:amino acid adenylation domain-containing protein|nr:Nonribosomal peptide synthetase [Bacteroidota bacterium]
MKDIYDLIIELSSKGLHIAESDNRIKITGNLEAITGTDKERIKQLKEPLLVFLKNNRFAKKAHSQIKNIDRGESYPLSGSQMRLWILSQFEDTNVAYNIPVAYVFNGSVKIETLELFFRQLVAKHEILRTVFRENGKGLVKQYILSPEQADFKIDCRDLRNLPDKKERIRELVYNDGNFSFDLSRAPLFKASLFREEDDKWIFSFVIHHIISDGWSMSIIVKELLDFYRNYEKATNEPSEVLRIHYKDYVAWQEEQFQETGFKQSKNYWLNKLTGDIPEINLPLCLKRPDEKTYTGHVITCVIAKDQVEKLKAICRQNDCTLFTGLVAIVKALLSKQTNLEDIILGTPVAGRSHKELENQIGFYLNTVLLRTQFSKEDSFTQLLKKVKGTVTDAFEHQNYPFDVLVDDLKPVRDMSRNTLFDIMVVLQNTEINKAEGLEFGGIQINNYPDYKKDTSLFDVTFEFLETGEQLELNVEYNTDLFTNESISSFASHFMLLSQSLLNDPAVSIEEADYLSASEKDLLLNRFNDTDNELPDKTIIDLFEEQAAKHPGNVCLVHGETALSYGQVNETVNRLAVYLENKHGVSQEDKIAIKLDRSEWLVIVSLAVLKTGAAYVPVDTGYPEERIIHIQQNSGCRIIFDERELELFKNEKDLYSNVNPRKKIRPTQPAYVIYTSGSTGIPKGVMVQHESLLNIGLSWRSAYRLDSFPVRLLQIAGFSFDVFTGDMIRTVINAGTMVICPAESRFDPESISHLLQHHKITVFESTPGLVFPLMQFIYENKLQVPDLKLLIVGSDTVNAEQFMQLHERFGSKIRIINSYGITEATIDSTYFELAANEPLPVNVPIGKPFHNIQAYILNEKLRLVPVGVTGELYISGKGLAKGYINNAAQNSERFIPHPFKQGERIYKTGDLARWQANGNIEFLGRNDNQVKIRGYRIETGEIANALLSLDSVNDAVVTVKENKAGEKFLVAYYVCNGDTELTETRNHLSAKLPAYMLPSYYVQLNLIPLTPNGKVDKKQLPDITDFSTTDNENYVAPETDEEKIMVSLWEDVLGTTAIGTNNDFFDLGGHSLKAFQLLNKIHKTFGVKLALKDIFRESTIKKQITLIRNTAGSNYSGIPQQAHQDGYLLSSSQKRLWISSQLTHASVAYNMFGAFVFEGDLNMYNLNSAFNTIIQRHEILRTVFSMRDTEEVKQYVKPLSDFRFEIREEHLGDIETARLTSILEEESLKAFDLEKGPLLRAVLYKQNDLKHVFAFTMHHIICDGWSMAIFIKEFLEIYNAGEKALLSPLRIQYKDYAVWQQQQLLEGTLDHHKEFWLKQFEDEIPVLHLPTDRMRPAVKTYAGSIIHFELDNALSESLKQLSRKHNNTLFITLLSAVNVLLYRYTGQRDQVIGTATGGRDHADLEDQIGFYINALPLRTRFEECNSFENILLGVKKTVMDAFEHRAYPFDKLVEEFKTVRDTSRSPLFDVMVDLQNVNVETIKPGSGMGDLRVKEYSESIHKISKFDLTFTFCESDNGLLCSIEYNTNLFNKSTVQRLSLNFKELVQSILNYPELPVELLNFVSENEKDLIQNKFNNTFRKTDPNLTVLDLISEKVKEQPLMPAVTYDNITVTYKDLAEKSDALAACLKETYSVDKGDRVGILLNNSEKVIISILAVLKTGGAYVPIDPAYPTDRINYILNDSEVKALLTETDHLFNISDYQGAVFAMDVQMDDLKPAKADCIVTGGDLAYLIYTSGSTGRPKGVMIEHRNLINYCVWASEYYFESSGRGSFGLFSSLSFDLTVTSIFVPLIRGKSIKVLQTEGTDFSDIMLQYFVGNVPDAIKLTPSHLQVIIPEICHAKDIKTIILGGEAVPVKIISELKKERPDINIYNEYGPTETTVGCTALEMTDLYSIGKPVYNTKIHILDKSNQVVPIGVYGEICVTGAGVARGYVNRGDLTESKFIHGTGFTSGAMYKTGDVGRWLEDGNIEYAGRNDQQVKVRGFRIELNEVENVLREYSHINDTLVDVRKNKEEEKNLVAYVVSDKPVVVKEIRSFLAKKLPAYMIPGYFVQVEKIPLSQNGKADKSSLPDPYIGFIGSDDFELPANEVEEKLLAIWKEVLGIEKIGVKDDFFELGGHSIKAISLLSKIHKVFGIKIGLEVLFDYKSIRLISDHIQNQEWLSDMKNADNTDEFERIKI